MKKILLAVPVLLALFASNGSVLASESEVEKVNNLGDEYQVELTYEEAMQRVSELSGEPVKKVKERYQIQNQKQTKKSLSVMATASTSCHYIETSTNIYVTSSYQPNLAAVLDACNSGSFSWLSNKKPFYVGLVADGKKFDGAIRLEVSKSGFNYLINGDFNNHGTMTHQGTAGVNAIWTTTYTISSASNFYKSYYSGLKWRQVTR
ncbi:hypothetical protein [Exiguobacterium sp.]|uniref:hypothetical protein n=1 Tax=Exiguobacterium sp. TaxID=44751 RepID=UPI0028A7183D|nr:hypothetical protein [Exiguobacterium sp.]